VKELNEAWQEWMTAEEVLHEFGQPRSVKGVGQWEELAEELERSRKCERKKKEAVLKERRALSNNVR